MNCIENNLTMQLTCLLAVLRFVCSAASVPGTPILCFRFFFSRIQTSGVYSCVGSGPERLVGRHSFFFVLFSNDMAHGSPLQLPIRYY